MVLGERRIPVPASISPDAQHALRNALIAPMNFPPPDDLARWEALIRQTNAQMEREVAVLCESPEGADSCRSLEAVATSVVAGVTVHTAAPPQMSSERERYAYLVVHGGALVFGAGDIAKYACLFGVQDANCTCYSVDYRVPPRNPYPAAVHDTVAVYCDLLKQYGAGNVIVSGASAGANIAAAAVLKVRDAGIEMPAALVLETPQLDLTESGDSFQTLLGLDYVLQQSLLATSRLYANGHDLSDPYLSPLFADFSDGFPPTFLQSGTRDLFLSNAVRMHRALLKEDIPAELHVWEAMPHGCFSGTAPEDREVRATIGKFVNRFFCKSP